MPHNSFATNSRWNQSNVQKCQLLPAENSCRVEMVKEMVDRGFPFSYEHIEECANELLAARLGEEVEPVGRNWAK